MEQHRFYVFDDNYFHTRGFTWAASIVPRSEKMDWVCPECGAIHRYPIGAFDVVVEGGVKYPDVLGCAYPFCIVSDRVVAGWQEAGITCFNTYAVGIAKVKSKRLQDVPPPQYHSVEIDGACRIDLFASGAEEIILSCPECHRVLYKPDMLPSFRMVPDSWDGCDLFRDHVLFPRVSFCTEKVLNLAREYRWTNFRFEPMEGPFDCASKGVDYLKGRPTRAR